LAIKNQIVSIEPLKNIFLFLQKHYGFKPGNSSF